MVLTSYAFQQCVLYPGCPNRKRNTKTQSRGGWGVGGCSILCAFTMTWWKLTLLLPHNYFGKSLTQSQIICSPTRTSLAKKKGILGVVWRKTLPGAPWLCWGLNIVPLWMIEHCDFPGGLSCPGEHSRFLCTKGPCIWATAERTS